MDSADFSICTAGIAVPAAASACTVGTDVDTFRTAAGRPLVRISLDQQGLFQKLFKQVLVDAATKMCIRDRACSIKYSSVPYITAIGFIVYSPPRAVKIHSPSR